MIVAPAGFAGSLSAVQVAAHLTAGLRRARPDIPVLPIPVADGGEGTVDAMVAAGFSRMQTNVSGPVGDSVVASFAMRAETAVVELAEASGLRRLRGRPDAASALYSTSTGTGELIRTAVAGGARRIVLGLGGSACTDGGAGLLTALGARLLDAHGHPLPPGGAALRRLAYIDTRGLLRVPLVVASAVDNPLLGRRGAAQVHAPFKGAGPREVDALEAGLARFAEITRRELGADEADRRGAGAGGGVGFAALAFLDATIRPGIEIILEELDFGAVVAGARVVVTGEGALDEQTLYGRAPIGVARAAWKAEVPVVAVSQRCEVDRDLLRRFGVEAAFALTDMEPDPRVCASQAGSLLEQLAVGIADAHLGRRLVRNY